MVDGSCSGDIADVAVCMTPLVRSPTWLGSPSAMRSIGSARPKSGTSAAPSPSPSPNSSTAATSTPPQRLGIPRVSAQAALIRAGRACKRSDRDDDFRRLIGETALDLQANPVNFGHRRRHLNAAWDIPEDDWQRLVEAMLAARVARADTPWERRRTDLRIWLWSHVTSGDPALAPMIQSQSAVRRSTDEAISSYTTLRRRAVRALEKIVTAYAADLAERVDARSAAWSGPSAHRTLITASDCTGAENP